MNGAERPGEELYLLPEGGMVVTSEFAYLLHKLTNLDKVRARVRGRDRDFDIQARALRTVAMSFDSFAQVPQDGSEHQAASELLRQWSSGEIAEKLGIGIRAVVKAIHEGRLPAQKIDGRWLVSEAAFEHFRSNRLGNGRGRA